jgi:hypothetical protein
MKSYRLDYYNPREGQVESIYDEIQNNLLARFNSGGYYRDCEIRHLYLIDMNPADDVIIEELFI